MDAGDIGGVVGLVAAGGLAAKLIGQTIMATTLGPLYLIGASAVAGYYLGHQVGHSLTGSR